MGPDDNVIFWKRFLQPFNDALKIFKNSLFMIPQTFGIFPAHASGGASELGFLVGVVRRFE
jgi:hypothetical protein